VTSEKETLMNTSKQLIESVAEGKVTASSVVKDSIGIREFMDGRDITDAVMLVIRNDGKLYRSLMAGKVSAAQAASQGIQEYKKALFRDISEDINAAKKDVEAEIKRWIATVKREG
jgi:hypothetical protein